jgi:hypothetical protein
VPAHDEHCRCPNATNNTTGERADDCADDCTGWCADDGADGCRCGSGREIACADCGIFIGDNRSGESCRGGGAIDDIGAIDICFNFAGPGL